VLYGLDDGSKSFEESVAMLEMSASSGTTDIVGTPHSDLTYKFQPDLIRERVAELQSAIGEKIRLHHGCDFNLYFDNIQDCLENPFKYTINHKRYLLVEFDNYHIPSATGELLNRMLNLDITPVITHPERNPLLCKRVEEMVSWIRNGCLLQVTAQSFSDRFGKRARETACELVDRRMVHFVASDAHGTEDRTPLLTEAFAYVVDHYGEETATALFSNNPRMTLTGEYLAAEDPIPAKKKRWFW
jgi:protein-tyrosine phosphatase